MGQTEFWRGLKRRLARWANRFGGLDVDGTEVSHALLEMLLLLQLMALIIVQILTNVNSKWQDVVKLCMSPGTAAKKRKDEQITPVD